MEGNQEHCTRSGQTGPSHAARKSCGTVDYAYSSVRTATYHMILRQFREPTECKHVGEDRTLTHKRPDGDMASKFWPWKGRIWIWLGRLRRPFGPDDTQHLGFFPKISSGLGHGPWGDCRGSCSDRSREKAFASSRLTESA